MKKRKNGLIELTFKKNVGDEIARGGKPLEVN